jgi:hypothetical protein
MNITQSKLSFLLFLFSFGLIHSSDHKNHYYVMTCAEFCQKHMPEVDIIKPVKKLCRKIDRACHLDEMVEFVQSQDFSIFRMTDQELQNLGGDFSGCKDTFLDLKKYLASTIYRYVVRWYKNDLYDQMLKIQAVEGYLDDVTEQRRLVLIQRVYEHLGSSWKAEHLLHDDIDMVQSRTIIMICYRDFCVNANDSSDEFIQVIHFLEKLKMFHKNLLLEYEYCLIPYTWYRCQQGLVAASMFGLAYVYRSSMKHYFVEGLVGAVNFYEGQIKDPLDKAYNSLQKNIAIPRLNLEKKQAQFDALIQREIEEPLPIGKEMSKLGAAFQQGAEFTQLNKVLGSRMDAIGLKSPQKKQEFESFEDATREILQRDIIVLAYPEKNIEKLPRALLRNLLDIMLDGGKEINEILEDMYATNHKIVSVAACMPVAALVVGVSFFATKGYNKSVYQPFCKSIRRLSITLNQSLKLDSCSYTDGIIYFYSMQLQDYASLLEKDVAKKLSEDVQDLLSIHLNYQQKYNVVTRMYGTYEFLLPGAV